jgi:hypothetical protein
MVGSLAGCYGVTDARFIVLTSSAVSVRCHHHEHGRIDDQSVLARQGDFYAVLAGLGLNTHGTLRHQFS